MRVIDWTPRIDRYREHLVRKRIILFSAFGSQGMLERLQRERIFGRITPLREGLIFTYPVQRRILNSPLNQKHSVLF